jgi:hypothetical protein
MNLNLLRRSLSTHKLTVTGLALCVLAISTASAGAWFRSRAADSPPIVTALSERKAEATAGAVSRKEEVESEVITLLPTGFSPSEISRPKGRFLVVIDNRTELEEVTFSLHRDDGQKLREAKRTKEQLIWRQIEDLPPGEYRLTVLDHPEWVCRITIKPH